MLLLIYNNINNRLYVIIILFDDDILFKQNLLFNAMLQVVVSCLIPVRCTIKWILNIVMRDGKLILYLI